MTTYVVSRTSPGQHSGFKAPADVRDILVSAGATPVDRVVRTSRLLTGADSVRVAARLRRLDATDVAVLQYPNASLPARAMSMARGPVLTALVHDLGGLRSTEGSHLDGAPGLNLFDAVIVHTDAMARVVREVVDTAVELVVLGMFDYLVSGGPRAAPTPAPAPTSLHFVGNLHPDKAAFLHAGPALPANLTVYGHEFGDDLARRGLTYGGLLAMDDPTLPVDGFGLGWDGLSSARLEGPLGNYLRFNAPHKLSFYVAAGVPVMVPTESAVAPLVRELGVGICIDALTDAADAAADCSSSRWAAMCAAVAELRTRVTSGWHTRRAVEQVASAPRG